MTQDGIGTSISADLLDVASYGYYCIMPSPTSDETNSVMFKAIWEVIKDWDINVPGYYSGYCSANGSHVKLILDGLKLENVLKLP